MSKSSKNSKESSSKEIGKVVNDDKGKNPKNDKLKKDEGSKSQLVHLQELLWWEGRQSPR